MQNQKNSWRALLVALLCILGAASGWTGHVHAVTVAAADMPKRGPECFSRLEGTRAITPGHRVRLSLRGFTRDSTIPDSKNAVIDVEPSLLSPAFFECDPKLSPSGAIQAKAVFLDLRDVPAPNGDSVGIGISAMAHNGLSEYDGYAIKIGFLIPRGQRFGLDLYQYVTRTKNGVPQADSSFPGAKFIGRSPGGLYVGLDCVDFDYTRDFYCHLWEELTDDAMLSIEIPTKNLSDWQSYSQIGEKYFFDHVEK